jgi:hypothetical protein
MPTPGTTYDELISADASIDTGALDCVTTALNRLYYQWQGGANWQALMTTLGQVVQNLETLQEDIAEQRSLLTATGVQLDYIGELFGVARGSFDDELYRLAIIAKGAAMTSSGTTDELIGILQVMFEGADVNVLDAYPANIIVTVADTPLDLSIVAFVASVFLPAVAAGVGSVFVASDPSLVGGWSSTTGVAPSGVTPGVWSSSTGANPNPDPLSLWSFAI